MPYNHGVYNQEQETSLTTPIQGTAGLQVIFGTAPIHLAADPAAAVAAPGNTLHNGNKLIIGNICIKL